jgi:hypothetical protein
MKNIPRRRSALLLMKLEPETKERIRAAATAHETTMTALIERVVIEWLDLTYGPPVRDIACNHGPESAR